MAHGMVDLAQFSETSGESWIQIMKTGEFQHPKHKTISITPNDLAQFADNFKRNVRGVDLAVDVSHNPDAGAVAWFKDVRIDNDKLMAKVDWTPEGANLVKTGKYRYFSPEFMFSWTDPATGQTHKNVLMGGGLTNRPFLKNMEPVAFSESGMGEVWMSDDEGDSSDSDYAPSIKQEDGSAYDPDGDGDDDSTTDPRVNPDWMQDVKMGATKWPKNPAQQAQLIKAGMTKAACDKKFDAFQMVHPMPKKTKPVTMGEPSVTNTHKTPPKGKPQNRDLYADPDNYKYPIDKKHIKAAVGYYNHEGMQEKGGYSDAQWAEIGKRIAAAANRLIAPGHTFADGKIDTKDVKVKMAESDVTDYDPDDNPDDGIETPHPTDDVDAGKFHEGGTHMPDNVVTMAEFQAAQQKIQMLETENRHARLTEKVRGWLFDEQSHTGKLVPAQQDATIDMLMAMSDEQVTKFEEFLKAQPDLVQFGEVGFSGAAPAGPQDKSQQVVKLAEKIEREEHLSWKEAFIRASDELGVK